MKVHLIKDKEVGKETFSEVVDLLQTIPGPIEFKFDIKDVVDFSEDDFVETTELAERDFGASKKIKFESKIFPNPVYSVYENPKSSKTFNFNIRPLKIFSFPIFRRSTKWSTLFKKCNKYRNKYNIPNDEFVILLTEVSNTSNWFASLDEKQPYNGFIHTADWNHFIKCQDSFPIAYEVIALILQKHLFNSYSEINESAHVNPIGCINDLCLEKKDIVLKLRTADVCAACMKKLNEKLTVAVIQHALNIMESLRTKMLYSQNFNQNVLLSNLLVDEKKQIWLPAFGNIEIRLRPLEKTLYLFYLQHPEGVGLSFLCDYKEELYEIYTQLSNLGSLKEMKVRIDDMTNTNSNSATEKISKIKACFIKAIGETLARHYYIQGGNGEVKKINLNPSLIQ
jgi:hypothetical protein